MVGFKGVFMGILREKSPQIFWRKWSEGKGAVIILSMFYLIDNFCNQFILEFRKKLIKNKKSRIGTDCPPESENHNNSSLV